MDVQPIGMLRIVQARQSVYRKETGGGSLDQEGSRSEDHKGIRVKWETRTKSVSNRESHQGIETRNQESPEVGMGFTSHSPS